MLFGYHCPIQGRVCSLIIGVEAPVRGILLKIIQAVGLQTPVQREIPADLRKSGPAHKQSEEKECLKMSH